MGTKLERWENTQKNAQNQNIGETQEIEIGAKTLTKHKKWDRSQNIEKIQYNKVSQERNAKTFALTLLREWARPNLRPKTANWKSLIWWMGSEHKRWENTRNITQSNIRPGTWEVASLNAEKNHGKNTQNQNMDKTQKIGIGATREMRPGPENSIETYRNTRF